MGYLFRVATVCVLLVTLSRRCFSRAAFCLISSPLDFDLIEYPFPGVLRPLCFGSSVLGSAPETWGSSAQQHIRFLVGLAFELISGWVGMHCC